MKSKTKKTKFPPLKFTLFNTILPQLKQQSSYFSIKAVQRVLGEQSIHVADQTLRKYLSLAMTKGIVNDAGRGWYSRHSEPVVLVPNHVKKIISLVKKLFPLLDFCCWSTFQLNPFVHHMIANQIILLYADIDALSSVADRLTIEGWKVWDNPKKAVVDRYVTPGDNTVVIRPNISKQPKAKNHLAPVEKVMVDLIAEVSPLYLMDISEAQLVVENILSGGLIQVPDFIGYLERRKLRFTSKEIIY